MKLKLLALLAVFTLFAAACGDDDGDAGDTSAGDDAVDDAGDDAVDDGDDAVDDGDDAVDDGGDDAAASTAGQGGELLLLQWQAPSQANAYLSTGTKDIQASSLVLEPMAWWGPEGQILTALAAEIPTAANGGISADLTEITWTLQEGLLWNDGTPVTSDDVVFSWEYCTDELTGCSADAYTTVVSVEAIDELTTKVTFDAPQPFPFQPFVGATNPVIQRAQFAECQGDAAKSCTEQNFAPVGTGPYMVTELRPEDTVLYEYNPLYRGNADGQPFFGTVTIKGGGDAEASARSVLEIGEADYAWNLQVAPELLGPMEAAGNGRVAVGFNSSVEHINLNQTDPRGTPPSDYSDGTNPNPFFFENPLLARALSIAINRDELVAVGYGANGEPTCNIWPVGSQNSTNNDYCLVQDVDEANRILDEDLGYLDTDGDGVRELPDGTPLSWDYVTSTNNVRQSNQDLINSYWEDIGIDVNMRNEDAGLFFDGTNASPVSIWRFEVDIEMFTNNSVGPDAQSYLGGYRTSEISDSITNWGGNNIVRLASDELDALWEELAATPLDDPARDGIVIAMNDIISSSSGSVIPLINRGSVSAWANDIVNTGEINGWDTEYYNIQEWTRSG